MPAGDAAVQVAEAKQRGPRWNGFFVEDGAAPCVGGLAGGKLIQLAEKATAAGDHERDDHAVAWADCCNPSAHFLDNTHELMAENVAMLGLRNLAAIEVQVRPADGRGRHAQDNVVGLLQDRIRNGVDLDVMGAVIGESSHVCDLPCEMNDTKLRVVEIA